MNRGWFQRVVSLGLWLAVVICFLLLIFSRFTAAGLTEVAPAAAAMGDGRLARLLIQGWRTSGK
jgi:hypothetical protein